MIPNIRSITLQVLHQRQSLLGVFSSKERRLVTTMLMLGRESALSCTQRHTIAAILATALGGYFPLSLGSTHRCTCTSSPPSPGIAPVMILFWGCLDVRPVKSSNSTIPKLYTSFSLVNSPVALHLIESRRM